MSITCLSMFFRRGICAVLAAAVVLGSLVIPVSAQAASTGTTTAKVVLRKNADKESKALQTLPKGEEVDILSTSGSWYKVRCGSFTGYVMKNYIKSTSSSGSSKTSSSVSAKIKALGTAPGIMRVGDENSDVKKLQQALEILGYYDGKIDGKYGKGTAEAVREYQEDKNLTADGYAGKYTVKSIFGSCNSRTLTKQPEPAASKKTTASSSSSSSSSSSKSKYPTVNSIAAIGTAPTKTQPGDRGTNVVKLQQALEYLGYFNGAIDGVFGDQTTAAVKRFQSKKGMKADGIAGSSTLRLIFGDKAVASSGSSSSSSSGSSVSYKTEVLDWYKDKVTNVIPKKAKFTIKDCLTGKTFNMVRWSGGDHMDAEPATAEDAAIVKAIYGGSYSWRRRAILIKYNGHVYAASMNGMPHGDDTRDENEFDGHLCIHFKNSKTHGSDKIDPDHQNAVDKASKYRW